MNDLIDDWSKKRYHAWEILNKYGYEWNNDSQSYINDKGNSLPGIVTELMIDVQEDGNE